MPRPATGQVVEKQTSDGRTSYAIRFRALGQRRYCQLGYSPEWTHQRAEQELADTLADVRRGRWAPPEPVKAAPTTVPTFHEFASAWLAARAGELRATTRDAYRWDLTDHLLPHFAGMRLDEIDVAAVDAYRDSKLRENDRRRAAIADGKPLLDSSERCDSRGRLLGPRALAPLSATSINRHITRLGQILDVAQERDLITVNPVRINPRNRKVRSVRPRRPWLEPDQVLALLHAAGELDRDATRGLPVRRPLLATLAWAGLRVGEACALRWRHVDLPAGVIHVPGTKTAAAERDVDLQPELRDELLAWKASTPFAGGNQLAFVTGKGRALNRHNVRQRVVLRAVQRANERLERDGREPLPDGLSPHALRRSFASWLLVEGEDVPYVQAQLGHTDPSMTLGIYAQAVKTGRRSARSRRRMEALSGHPLGTNGVGAARDGLEPKAA